MADDKGEDAEKQPKFDVSRGAGGGDRNGYVRKAGRADMELLMKNIHMCVAGKRKC